MSPRAVSFVAFCVLFTAVSWSRARIAAQDYTLGFSGPDSVWGSPGDTVSADYLCTLTQNNLESAGAQGWSIGCVAEGGVITAATTDGTTTADVFAGGFNNTSLALPEDNDGVSGAVSAIILCFGCPAVVPIDAAADATVSLLAISVDWTMPKGCDGTGQLLYVAGLIGGGQPVDLVLTENGRSTEFATTPLSASLFGAGCGGGCCGPDYLLGFATARDAPMIDDDGRCMGTGHALAFPGSAIYCQVVSNGGDGVQGWSIGVEATGDVDITDVTIENTSAADVADGGKFSGGFNNTSLVDSEASDGRKGAVSAIVLCFGCPNTLEPIGTESILQLTVDFEPGASGGLRYADGLIGGGQPVDNVLTVNGHSAPICNFSDGMSVGITLGCCLPPGPDRFIRGDANADAKVNIADAIWIISELFRSGPPTACQIAADANADDAIDLADAFYIISYRFLGGATPPAPFPECGPGRGFLTCDQPPPNC